MSRFRVEGLDLRAIPRETIGFVPAGLHGVAIRLGHEHWYFPAAALCAVACMYFIYKLPLLEALCVAVLAPLLFAYHVTWYDGALLALPITVAWQIPNKKVRAGLLLLLLYQKPKFGLLAPVAVNDSAATIPDQPMAKSVIRSAPRQVTARGRSARSSLEADAS